jgi:hypothetical protein
MYGGPLQDEKGGFYLSITSLSFVITDPGAVQKLESSEQAPKSRSLLASTSDEPLQHSVQVCLLFRAYAIAAYFTMGDALQIQSVNQLVNGHLLLEIRFVAEDQQGDTFQDGLFEQQMELILCDGQGICVGRVDDKDDGVHTSAVSLPH